MSKTSSKKGDSTKKAPADGASGRKFSKDKSKPSDDKYVKRWGVKNVTQTQIDTVHSLVSKELTPTDALVNKITGEPMGGFKGSCFHCGTPGHSARECPEKKNGTPQTESGKESYNDFQKFKKEVVGTSSKSKILRSLKDLAAKHPGKGTTRTRAGDKSKSGGSAKVNLVRVASAPMKADVNKVTLQITDVTRDKLK